MNIKILFPLVFCISACISETGLNDDNEPVVSGQMITSFLQLSECLSLHATPEEKLKMIQTSRTNRDFQNKETFEAYMEQSRADMKFLKEVAATKCPVSLNLALTALNSAKDEEIKGYVDVIMQEMIVSNISGEILSRKEKQEGFNNAYQTNNSNNIPKSIF